MPSLTSSVLNHAITCFEKNLSSVIQCKIDFARNNNVEINRVSSVHTWMIRFQNLNHSRQLWLNFFDSGCAADLFDTRRCIRRNREEPEAEPVRWRKIARLRWRSCSQSEGTAKTLFPNRMHLCAWIFIRPFIQLPTRSNR